MPDTNFCPYCQLQIHACKCTPEELKKQQELEEYEYQENVARLKRQGFEFDPNNKTLVSTLTHYALINEREKPDDPTATTYCNYCGNGCLLSDVDIHGNCCLK